MMKNKTFIKFIYILIFFVASNKLFSLSLTDLTSSFVDTFFSFVDPNEGTTSFRSLLIPSGGRTESLGSAYTGLCDDIGYLNYNAAGSAIQKQTQLAAIHNSWIADSNLETLSFTTRNNHFGFGTQLSCFYLPFTEYNIFGERVNGNYYTETAFALNFSYNFFAGYNFKGLALGTTLRAAWRGMPNYSDNDTNIVIPGTGLQQSALGLMGDIGILLQFNFFKYFDSRDANFRIGLAANNLGFALTNFGGLTGIQYDDPLPTTLSAGISYRFIKPITVSIDFKQPINLQNIGQYLAFSIGTGISIQFTDFLSVLAGFSLKGGNPKLSLGCDFDLLKLKMNITYSLDFTSSVNPINKFSLSAKILLGDRGRSIKEKEVDSYYLKGLDAYAKSEWQAAIDIWQESLKLDKRFDPAILGIKSAQTWIDMIQSMKDSQTLSD